MSDAGTKTPLSADRVPSGAEMKAAKPGREDPMVRMNINFLLAHKDYAIIPFVVAGLLAAAWTHDPIASYLEDRGLAPWGAANALKLTFYALTVMFATHGLVCCYEKELAPLKIQSGLTYLVKCPHIAERSIWAISTTLIYAFLPCGTVSPSWLHYIGNWFALALTWDLYFYLVHGAFHLNKSLYRFFHKTHHTYKDPNCFSAYYVSYCSHLVTEQLFLLAASLVVPSDVLVHTLYFGTVATHLTHSGYELTSVKLPFINVAIGTFMPTLPGFGQSAAHHDIHHEKFFNNYALNFTLFDKVLGTEQKGRVPGVQEPRKPSPAAAAVAVAAAPAPDLAPVKAGRGMARVDSAMDIASFTELKHATPAEVQLLADKYQEELDANLLTRVLNMLKDQDKPELMLGTQVTLYEHGLQTATRAHRDGASEEMVVASLLHDVGEMHCPSNHGEIAASILRPFVSPETSWVLEQHEVFQMYYYAHKTGAEDDRHRREHPDLRASPHWQACADFCEKWDQAAFDPDYDSLPLEFFEPMVRNVLSREPFWWKHDHPKRGACGVTGIADNNVQAAAIPA
eukprot:CAMPEP_0198684340 /NCGR_PEP_ID=MMETSP1468-20131203/12040_1 /TAXON_ID=1461545 /ORGANISM="Mantoniella sp, Strain CCMP1436" /LENGTH=568 /DNA_ID=CAMNT_0044429063 /DNA_START=307 /DNA_END=2013 /DNA_ORIENTATION=+